MNNDGVPAPLVADDDYRGAAPGLRNRRFRAALYLAAWGAGGIISTTVPSLAANNPDHVMVYFLLLMSAVLLLLLSMAAVDLPWLERAAARLEFLLADLF
jgi:hypothetical protein